MNFSRKIIRTVDILLILLLALQISKMSEMTGGWQNYHLPYLKSMFSGSETQTDTGAEADSENTGDTEAGGDTAGANSNAEAATGADSPPADAADSGGIAAVSFAGKEELTAEMAASLEDFTEITVLITNKRDGGYCHSTLSFSFAADVVYTAGGSTIRLKAGDTLRLDAEDFETGESLRLEAAADGTADGIADGTADTAGNTGAFTLDFCAETGSEDSRTYAGILEITVAEDGFLLRNTLPLEEYLRCCVPAEMPASYPAEALKAQAICARTYAIRSALSGAFSKYGADISDDTSCQVYNTQGTAPESDAAVFETAGEYLVYDGEPACCYYFSTSCGVTTDAGIWEEEIAYLKSVPVREISAEAVMQTDAAGTLSVDFAVRLKEEDFFRSFLDGEILSAESAEAWYRWRVSFPLEKLAARLEEEIGAICSLEITKRGSGGVATELTVCGSSGREVIGSQSEIREFFRLEEGISCTLQDQTVVSDSMLLPSAFFYLQMGTDGTVTLVGGGFGHGCGMSQNGAKAYANAGAGAYEILSFFYPGTKIYDTGA